MRTVCAKLYVVVNGKRFVFYFYFFRNFPRETIRFNGFGAVGIAGPDHRRRRGLEPNSLKNLLVFFGLKICTMF